MKKTKLISLVLIGAIFSAPLSVKAPEPKVIEWLFDLCSVEVMGSLVVIAACVKKIWFDPPKWPSDMIGDPPDDSGAGSSTDDNSDNDWSGMSLPKVASCPTTGQYTNQMLFTIQASPDLSEWTNAFTFNVWESPQGRLLLVSDTQGVPVSTNYVTMNAQGVSTNRWPGLSKGKEPHLFYRLATPRP